MSGPIVSNTGPLIALAVIGRLDILKDLFTAVIIPEAVNAEILAGGANLIGLSAYKQASWIEVRQLSQPLDPLLDTVLDSGEASAIQLARECGTDLVLIDERKGRKVARKIYKIRVIGTARVLVEEKHHGILDNVRDAISAMRANGYWLHDSIVNFALQQAGEI